MPLLSLLNHPKKSIRKEACWTISNITAGNKQQIQSVIDANIIPLLVNLLSNAEYEVKKEAAWGISNATSGGSEQQIQYLVEQVILLESACFYGVILVSQGCIKPLCDLLTVFDARILVVALEALENILKVGKKIAGDEENPYALLVGMCLLRYVGFCSASNYIALVQRKLMASQKLKISSNTRAKMSTNDA